LDGHFEGVLDAVAFFEEGLFDLTAVNGYHIESYLIWNFKINSLIIILIFLNNLSIIRSFLNLALNNQLLNSFFFGEQKLEFIKNMNHFLDLNKVLFDDLTDFFIYFLKSLVILGNRWQVLFPFCVTSHVFLRSWEFLRWDYDISDDF
jgi:hypothetical protein